MLESSGRYHANGPYWDGPVQNFTAGHVLNYFQQLRTLNEEAIAEESKRVRKARADFKRPVDSIQYLLVLVASEVSLKNYSTIRVLISELKENTSFVHTEVKELLFLIEASVSSNLASQLHSTSFDGASSEDGSKTIELQRMLVNATISEAVNKSIELQKKLKSCNEQSKTLADQIQKLKDIERILTDREQ